MNSAVDASLTERAALGRAVGWAWTALAASLGLHVADEAVHGFLPIWNATVLAIRESSPWLPLPVFRYDIWLAGLIAGVLAMLAVIPAVRAGVPWTRTAAWALALIMIGNAMGHTVGTIFGRTVDTVVFARPMPGFLSSPFLLAASLCLLWTLRCEKRCAAR
ncbi:MAG: hypothetical protein JNL98_11930 [Bryobacterales bacterium]|nr:hypothetical protein [Bryobacterales bacterium]